MGVREFRVKAWVSHCLAVADCSTYKDLSDKIAAALPMVDGKPAGPESNVWSRYDSADTEPSPETVQQIGHALPGTAITWNKGPAGLPVWGVLNRDLSTCASVVDGLLDDYQLKKAGGSAWMLQSKLKVTAAGMTLIQKCQALLEISVPSSYWQKSGSDLPDDKREIVDMAYEPRDKWYYTLPEFLSKDGDGNALAHSFERGSHKFKTTLIKNAAFMVRGEFKILKPEIQIGLLAATALCNFNADNNVRINDDERVLLKRISIFIMTGGLPAFNSLFKNSFDENLSKLVIDFVDNEF